jgi:hypothetical protein
MPIQCVCVCVQPLPTPHSSGQVRSESGQVGYFATTLKSVKTTRHWRSPRPSTLGSQAHPKTLTLWLIKETCGAPTRSARYPKRPCKASSHTRERRGGAKCKKSPRTGAKILIKKLALPFGFFASGAATQKGAIKGPPPSPLHSTLSSGLSDLVFFFGPAFVCKKKPTCFVGAKRAPGFPGTWFRPTPTPTPTPELL